MKSIHTTSDWNELDVLNGKEIKDGEYLKIQWPDGSCETRRVSVEKRSYEEDDMGHSCTIPVHKAFVYVEYRGVRFKAYLANRKIKVERVKRGGKR
jgi:hypothetical protein